MPFKVNVIEAPFTKTLPSFINPPPWVLFLLVDDLEPLQRWRMRQLLPRSKPISSQEWLFRSSEYTMR